MKSMTVLAVSACMLLSACATASKDLTPTYTSPLTYQAYDCEQLSAESQRIQARVVQLGGRLDTAASNDKAIAGVGALLFWPALFALGGTKQQEADYSRLRGEYDAVQQSAIVRKCPGVVTASNVPPVA
jgi:hypothetical protein